MDAYAPLCLLYVTLLHNRPLWTLLLAGYLDKVEDLHSPETVLEDCDVEIQVGRRLVMIRIQVS